MRMNLNKSSNVTRKVSKDSKHHYDCLTESDNRWLNEQSNEEIETIQALFAASHFVADTCKAQPGLVTALFSPPFSYQEYEFQLSEQLKGVNNEPELAKQVRLFRHREMAKITARDFASQSIEASLQQVSDLADIIIFQTYHRLYTQFCEKYGKPESHCPLCIIAMGKLGGRELNFSSDIDLIFAYPKKGETVSERKAMEHQVFFTRLAQRLIYVLDHISTDGQAYRVDMRLRPLGESGPLVMHFAAFSDYYHEQAREWERFAMLKARVLNPTSTHTKALENIIQPFVFKRYLDFTTLDALRAMKEKIFADSRRRQLGENIKLGEGGIREAEFFIQYFQLIHGGQSGALQTKNWLEAAAHVCKEGFITQCDHSKLRDAYLYLRKIEHALQQRNNDQTQLLPNAADEWEAIASLVNASSVEKMRDDIIQARSTIHRLFNSLFVEQIATKQQDQHANLARAKMLWLADQDESELTHSISTLFCKGCGENSARVSANAILSFKHKCERAQLSDRAYLLINELVPLILVESLTQHDHFHRAQERVLCILHAVIGRTTYLDLLLNHPKVRQQLFVFCSASPWMAEQVRCFPLLLDELLSQAYLHSTATSLFDVKREYEDELRQSLLRVENDDVENYMNVLRQFRLCQQFRIAAADIHGSLPIEQVSDRLTLLAEVIVTHVIQTAYFQMTQKYGSPELSDGPSTHSPIDNFAVIAFGKLGGYELGYRSDLDLVFVHNSLENTQTNGNKVISAQQFYIKLAQRAMHLFNTKTLLGELYETDLRLRPAGNAGLLCCHVSGFEHYQQNEAWTWEHQALVRARVIFGGHQLRQQIEKIRIEILYRRRDLPSLKQDIASMRAKLFSHNKRNNKQDFKHGVGGITDIEFISQFLVLAYSVEHTDLTKWPDNLRIIDIAEHNDLLAHATAQKLTQAYLSLRNHQHRTVLQVGVKHNANKQNEQAVQQTRKYVHQIWCTLLSDYTMNQ